MILIDEQRRPGAWGESDAMQLTVVVYFDQSDH